MTTVNTKSRPNIYVQRRIYDYRGAKTYGRNKKVTNP